MFDTLWKNINLATMAEDGGYGLVYKAVLGFKDGRIAYAGPERDAPAHQGAVFDGEGKWATPALIDCHTHLAYAGDRADEFEKRLHGISYEEIAKAGGGILSTVNAVRAASEDDIYGQTLARLRTLFQEGVARFEIKSGYGLDYTSEKKLLTVATRLRDDLGLQIQRTFLGAHALPPEYRGRADDYIAMICDDMLPKLAASRLVDAVDGFCENIAFSAAQMEKVFKRAKELGLPVKLHAEQLTNQHGAALAAKYQALSADHLEYIDEDGVKAMAASGTVAVLLPGAFYYLREKTVPPIDLFRQYKVPMAIATDHNPGTSPVLSLLLMMNMASTLFGFTPEESFAGVTRHAAKALGWEKDCGTLEAGKAGDAALWDISHPRALSYSFGQNPCTGVILGGEYHAFES